MNTEHIRMTPDIIYCSDCQWNHWKKILYFAPKKTIEGKLKDILVYILDILQYIREIP